MNLTTTVNADKRYYLDEGTIENCGSVLDTLNRFNEIKMVLYNQMYTKQTTDEDPFDGLGYDRYLKQKYPINSYYTCCIYATASGQISSARELQILYRNNMLEDIKVRKNKIASVKEQLEKKQKIKDSIRTYAKTGKWKKPYPKCTIKVSGKNLSYYGKKNVPLSEYERTTEEKIRQLKHRLKMLNFGLARKESDLKDMEEFPFKKAVFGTRDFYRKKDQEGVDILEWKKEFFRKRHHSMSLPGRHTSKNCNFLVYLKEGNLHLKCMDGKETVFKGFHLARYWDEYRALLALPSKERKAICYNFTLEYDKDDRPYFIVSVTMELENLNTNYGFSDGCVAIDQNWDNITMSDIDADGKCLMRKTINFQLESKSSGQISCIIGNVMAEVGDYCKKVKKPLVMEDLDTTKSKNGMRYGSKKRNRHASMFAYKKISSCARSQGFQKDFEVYTVNPAYTSQIAKVRYMRSFGCSIHEAASYTIGLKCMEKNDLLTPPQMILDLIPEKTREGGLWKQWAYITKKFRGVRTHLFYGKPPTEELSKRKRPTLASYASALKDRDKVTC